MLLIGRQAMACTTLAVGKDLSKDGSTITSHSNDGEYKGDPRLCYIAAADHKAGSMRPVYFDLIDGPRYVTYDRGDCYIPKPGQNMSTPICYVPEVEHTFSYYEGSYSIMNEKGVGTSESTCSGMFYTLPATMGGSACFGIAALGQIAMERASTAREAVQIMGDMAVAHGFYGSNSFEGSAEALFVNDPDEIWIFHVLPDPTGKSAIWAAQRVPDNHVAVIANMFVIREIDFDDSDNFMYSSNVKTIAKERGWWTDAEPLDFTWIYSNGEYSHKYYSGRRMWESYRRFGRDFNVSYSDLRYDLVYPVSAPTTSGPFGVSDLFSIHRDYYQNTTFDMSKGMAAGPWGITDRWNNEQPVNGTWERSIAVYRTDYLSVVQAKRTGQGGVFYFGPGNAASTVFVPMAATCEGVPDEYMVANTTILSRSNAYWGSTSAFNVALMKYKYAMENIILPAQLQLETQGEELVAQLDAQASLLESGSPCTKGCQPYKKHMHDVFTRLWELPDEIVQTYANGWTNDGPGAPYPEWWLEQVNYTNMEPPALPAEPYGPCYPVACPTVLSVTEQTPQTAPAAFANALAAHRTSRRATPELEKEREALRAAVFSTPQSSLAQQEKPSKKSSFLARNDDSDAALFLQVETSERNASHSSEL